MCRYKIEYTYKCIPQVNIYILTPAYHWGHDDTSISRGLCSRNSIQWTFSGIYIELCLSERPAHSSSHYIATYFFLCASRYSYCPITRRIFNQHFGPGDERCQTMCSWPLSFWLLYLNWSKRNMADILFHELGLTRTWRT